MNNEKRNQLMDLAQRHMDMAKQCLDETGKNFVVFGGIGSAKRLTVYDVQEDIVHCGCQHITLAQFEDRVAETHGKHSPHHDMEYKAGIEFLRSCRKARLLYPVQDEPKYSEGPTCEAAADPCPMPQPAYIGRANPSRD